MLVLVDGQVQRFGTCQEVMAALQAPPPAPQPSNQQPQS